MWNTNKVENKKEDNSKLKINLKKDKQNASKYKTGIDPTYKSALKKANSPPGNKKVLVASIFQWGFSSSQKVKDEFLKAIVFWLPFPNKSEKTIIVEPEGKFNASDWVWTTFPPSKIPSRVEVFNKSDDA